jgi:hypothetical protein
MNKIMVFTMILTAFWISSCSSLHDGKDWEHMGDPETHQEDQHYILEHKH